MVLPNGKIWPIPITLHINDRWLQDNLFSENCDIDKIIELDSWFDCLVHKKILLKHETGLPLALMKIKSIYKMDLWREAENGISSHN